MAEYPFDDGVLNPLVCPTCGCRRFVRLAGDAVLQITSVWYRNAPSAEREQQRTVKVLDVAFAGVGCLRCKRMLMPKDLTFEESYRRSQGETYGLDEDVVDHDLDD